MGMFDSVQVKCPCGGLVDFQSKAGDCILNDFSINEVPLEIANDINGDNSFCNLCNKEYTINATEMPKTVEMYLKIKDI